MKLPAAAEMQGLDRSATEIFGIPSLILMENAGVGTVRMMERELGPCSGRFCLIFVGPGNNGGDGLVIGRHLHQLGCRPLFVFLVNPDTLKGDAAVNLQIVHKLGFPMYHVDSLQAIDGITLFITGNTTRELRCYAIIDAIFGIGLNREVEGRFAAVISRINNRDFGQDVPVVAVDIPSGMDANTGKKWGCCIQADYTATYGWAKPGHFINGKGSWSGKIAIIDIGIPPEAEQLAGLAIELITPQSVLPLLRHLQRKSDAHKGTHGHLMVLGGSPGKTGAAILTARGAMRSGAGLVSLCVPHELNVIYEICLTEAMTIPLPQSREILTLGDWALIEDTLNNMQVAVIGPGIGKAAETAEFVLRAYHELSCPLVVDADALNVLADNRDSLGPAAGPRVFTPHPGELSRLLDISTADIQNNRIEAAKEGQRLFPGGRHGAVLVLKGAGTVVAGSDGLIAINSSGNPGMGTGGMGDVLSGVIGAFLCQGMSLDDAAKAGVFIHGAAADILFDRNGSGFTASEVADMLPAAMREVFV